MQRREISIQTYDSPGCGLAPKGTCRGNHGEQQKQARERGLGKVHLEYQLRTSFQDLGKSQRHTRFLVESNLLQLKNDALKYHFDFGRVLCD